jgi:hypothetical protein
LKPTDIFIGVVELFAVVIPGAIAAFAVAPVCGSIGLSGTRGWVAFFIAAYTLGHIAFYLSGRFDDIGPVKTAADRAVHDMFTKYGGKSAGGDAYKDAKAYLAIHCPGPLGEVLRVEADSKFFRSLLVVVPFYVVVAIASVASNLADAPKQILVAVVALSPLLWVLSFFLATAAATS